MGVDQLVTGGDVNDPSVDSLDTESLVIGGTLYEEDDNSPIDESGVSSFTYTMADSADEIIIILKAGIDIEFNQLQVNGDSGPNYDSMESNDNETTGSSQWGLQRIGNYPYFIISGATGSKIGFQAPPTASGTDLKYRGENTNVSPPITQFTFKESGGGNAVMKARVYRRGMNV